MNTRKIIATLNRIANKLDNNGLYYISDKLTNEMVKISQTKFHEENKFKAEYADANEEFQKETRYKKTLDPEAFLLVQESLKDLYKKKQISKIMNPREIGRWMVKNPVDKNKLKNELYGTTNFSQTSAPSGSSAKSIFDKYPPLGSRVESGKTSNMTDDEKVKDYVELVARNLQIHNLDKALDWNDDAKEKLSTGAYLKFVEKQTQLYDQYSQWEADHPEQVAIRDGRQQAATNDDNDPFEKKTPGPATTSTSPTSPSTSDSTGLDRWVNKAENIYKTWSDRNMPINSTAPALIKDVLDYMLKVKNNLPSDKAADAQSKIDKVQSFIDNIRDKKTHTGTIKSYSEMTGFGGKEADPFGRGKRLDQKQLDYLAQQESKSY